MTDRGTQLVITKTDNAVTSSATYTAAIRVPSVYGPQIVPTDNGGSGTTKPPTGQLWPKGYFS